MMKKIIAALAGLFALALPSAALAQCSGIFTAGYFCGNSAASGGFAGAASPTAMFDRAFGNVDNSTVVRISGVWTVLSSANSGVWITSVAGVPSISSTLPNAVQDNITRLGTIAASINTAASFIVTPASTTFPKFQMTPGLFSSGTDGIKFLNANNTGHGILQPILTNTANAPMGFLFGSNMFSDTGGSVSQYNTSGVSSGFNLNTAGSVSIYTAAAAGTPTARFTISNAGDATFTRTATLGVNGGTGGQITLSGATSGSAVLKVAAAAGTSNFQFPVGNGSNTNVLATDGSGNTSWAAAGAGTVTSVICGTGLDGGTITTTGTCSLSAARRTFPTNQPFTTGTGATYTTPANALWLEVYIVAGGGGGGGGGTGGQTSGGTGGTTTFNSITAIGGSGGAAAPSTTSQNPGSGGGGGTGGTGTASRRSGGGGAPGGQALTGAVNGTGGPGGSAQGFGGGGTMATTGGTFGGGGGGSGTSSGGIAGAGGGGGGEVAYFIINSPAATYTYTVGVAGTAGGAGTSGGAGGAGAAGYIFVIEHYGS